MRSLIDDREQRAQHPRRLVVQNRPAVFQLEVLVLFLLHRRFKIVEDEDDRPRLRRGACQRLRQAQSQNRRLRVLRLRQRVIAQRRLGLRVALQRRAQSVKQSHGAEVAEQLDRGMRHEPPQRLRRQAALAHAALPGEQRPTAIRPQSVHGLAQQPTPPHEATRRRGGQVPRAEPCGAQRMPASLDVALLPPSPRQRQLAATVSRHELPQSRPAPRIVNAVADERQSCIGQGAADRLGLVEVVVQLRRHLGRGVVAHLGAIPDHAGRGAGVGQREGQRRLLRTLSLS